MSRDLLPDNLCSSGEQVKSVRRPRCFIASRRIEYANARSLGRMVSLCKLLSTMAMTASSSDMARTMQGTLSIPASSAALLRRCPLTSS